MRKNNNIEIKNTITTEKSINQTALIDLNFSKYIMSFSA